MTLTTEKTVREIALEVPGATRLFERLGIDYCCGGGKPLEEACQAAGVSPEQVLDTLEMDEFSARRERGERDWNSEPLAELISHIRNTHHKYTREELARFRPLADKVCAAHEKNHPELPEIRAIIGALAEELTMHMMKEEMILFPYIERMEESVIAKEPVLPPPFGSVRNPVAMMLREHDDAGGALRELRRITNAYTAPSDACVSYQTLYKALAEFEADLHQHIHLENNILFPRAVEIERSR
jgi:regulator of cell morphogenesis and NO signaling